MQGLTALPLDIWFQVPADRPNWNMAYSLTIAGIGFMLTAVSGYFIIGFLRRKGIGKRIRIDGPQSHIATKTGTPTMGGIIFNLTAFVLTFVFNLYDRLSMLLPLGILVFCSILGGIDDLLTITAHDQKQGNRARWDLGWLGRLVSAGDHGLTARFKFVWLFIFSFITAVILYWPLKMSDALIPVVGRVDIGILYIPIATLFIIGFSNAVNLTDGLDTLAGGTGAIAFVSYGIIAYIQGQVGVVTFCFIMVGGLLGFLWHNAHPAKVFMGDTGSLALGAALATCAFLTEQWVLLPIVGLVFVAVAASVILQVGYFKLTGGRRLFKIAPLHHHFELIGWSETQVTMRFWLVGMMAGLFGVALALLSKPL
jgi:phospho-N-acetylmuramoyl-pentapeptide-transferase